MTKILFINACARKESRTKTLADYLLHKLNGEIKEVDLPKCNLKPLDEATLNERATLIAQGKFEDEMFNLAKDFATADIIVVAAPYWDFSFPSCLKLYIEHINVINLVFAYSDAGEIISKCRAKKLYYVTTKGGYNPDDYGYGYIKALSDELYGIDDTYLIAAEGLDIIGNNVENILNKAKAEIDGIIK